MSLLGYTLMLQSWHCIAQAMDRYFLDNVGSIASTNMTSANITSISSQPFYKGKCHVSSSFSSSQQ
jgi:hypothetical protein